MKYLRLAALALLLCLVLAACSRFIPSSYTRVAAHSQTQDTQADTNVVNVGDYAGLRRAIRDFVRARVEHGVIRVNQYTGNIEDDLAAAAYNVAREDPVGAYAVDYMTHECTLIVSYYEIHVDITFRETQTPLSQIPYVNVESELKNRLYEAMDSYDQVLTIYAGYGKDPDYAALAEEYYEQNLGRLMALPQITVESYPQGGRPRIVELTFSYPQAARTLESMAQQVSDTLSAASVYVRFRESPWEKAQLLYSYLTERFTYIERQTQTPVYSLLCEGYATSWSMAQCWALLCQEVGLQCQVVSGLRGSDSYWWNEISLDGSTWYHLDLMQDVLNQTGLQLRYDEDMDGYYWDPAAYPACPMPDESPEQPDSVSPDAPQAPSEPSPDPGTEQPETPSADASAEPGAPESSENDNSGTSAQFAQKNT